MRRCSSLLFALGFACTTAPSSADPLDDSVGTTDAQTTEAEEDSTESTDADAVDSSSSADDADSSGTSGGETDCGPLPIGSPPAVLVQGETLVPIDALTVDATLSFDVASHTATGVAELTFVLGPEGGMPIFDLRQTITGVALDGVDLGADRAPFFQPSNDPAARMRAVTEVLEPCSTHTLTIEYEVALPDASNSDAPLYDPAGVIWSSRHSDLWPGRYAEQWWPSNLPHDVVAMALDVELTGGAGAHVLASNGEVSVGDDGQWHVEFPPHFTSLSPFVVLAPTALVEVASAPVQLPEGTSVTVDAIRLTTYGELIEDILATTGEALIAADLELGDYPHGSRFLVYSSGLEGGMEYEGATGALIGSIHHEVFHSWIARGMRPLRGRDGWIDETWTTYSVDLGFSTTPLTPDEPVELLASDDPWTRNTPSPAAYVTGPRVLATVAAEIGLDNLRGLLREFYQLHADELVTTEQLEEFLVCATEGEAVTVSFARWVHGEATPAAPADRTNCP